MKEVLYEAKRIIKMVKIDNCILCFIWCTVLYLCRTTNRKEVFLDSEELLSLYKPFIAFIWITGILFFTALSLGWKICKDIGSNQDFTVANADRLKIISVLAMIEGVLYIAALLYIFSVGSYHTNVLVIMLLILFFTIIISVFTSMLSYLVRKESEIKHDIDLTI